MSFWLPGCHSNRLCLHFTVVTVWYDASNCFWCTEISLRVSLSQRYFDCICFDLSSQNCVHASAFAICNRITIWTGDEECERRKHTSRDRHHIVYKLSALSFNYLFVQTFVRCHVPFEMFGILEIITQWELLGFVNIKYQCLVHTIGLRWRIAVAHLNAQLRIGKGWERKRWKVIFETHTSMFPIKWLLYYWLDSQTLFKRHVQSKV